MRQANNIIAFTIYLKSEMIDLILSSVFIGENITSALVIVLRVMGNGEIVVNQPLLFGVRSTMHHSSNAMACKTKRPVPILDVAVHEWGIWNGYHNFSTIR